MHAARGASKMRAFSDRLPRARLFGHRTRAATGASVLFNSVEFVFFLPIVLAVHFLVLRRSWRLQKGFLVVASYAFYMSWNPRFGVLLLLSTMVDYVVGLRLGRSEAPGRRRALLLVSVTVNLGILGFFKYGRFFAESVAPVVGRSDAVFMDVILPVGISFYTFQSLSYSIDVYRGTQRPCASLLDFMLYVAFFPQLVAGPIVRSGDFLPQMRARPPVPGPLVEDALARIAMGFVKKVVLADTLGEYVDQVFGHVGVLGGWNAVLATYAYAFQIYFDFSGYSDIAIGVAQLFGVRLPENFARPYLATSPREFWQRWHMSLSTWLRDYLYVPLGGNRRGAARMYVNVLLTMLLGGLWHGASWNFVAWGGFHGVLLAIERAMGRGRTAAPGAWRTWIGRAVTFNLICVGWILFRARTLGDAWGMFTSLADGTFVVTPEAVRALWVVVAAMLVHGGRSAARWRSEQVARPPLRQGAVYATAIILVFIFSPGTGRFIYFQF
jgi:D-alanyl-lipoteichoic acid acyltransferase DltB (MBOAT superfamily)